MLWITGSLLLVIWFVTTFLLHKGGLIHVILFAGICLFIVQFAQDRRTKEYRRSLKR